MTDYLHSLVCRESFEAAKAAECRKAQKKDADWAARAEPFRAYLARIDKEERRRGKEAQEVGMLIPQPTTLAEPKGQEDWCFLQCIFPCYTLPALSLVTLLWLL